MNPLEKLDRRAFLRGLMVTSAGLLVPRRTIFAPLIWPVSGSIVHCDRNVSPGDGGMYTWMQLYLMNKALGWDNGEAWVMSDGSVKIDRSIVSPKDLVLEPRGGISWTT